MTNKNKILNYWPFPYKPRQNQIDALQWIADSQEYKYHLLECPVGCHKKGQLILTYDGDLVPVEDITTNHLLMGPDSLPRRVLNTITGRQQMATIHPNKGEPFTVNLEHVLSLVSTNGRTKKLNHPSRGTGTEILNISVQCLLKKSKSFKSKYKLYRCDRVDFQNKHKLNIDPYLVGLLLGDGTTVNGHVGITTGDNEIISYLYHTANDLNLSVNIQEHPSSQANTYYISTGKRGGDNSTRKPNLLLEQLREDGLYEHRAKTKSIPKTYKTSSYQDRADLLAGLIDSDGHLGKNKSLFEYSTKSYQLACDIQFVARSLGLYTSCKKHNRCNNTYYSVYISGHLNIIPTKIPRKQAIERKQKKRPTVTGFDIEVHHGEDYYYGFTVDRDNLYVLGDFTVTHNSGKSNIGLTYSLWLSDQYKSNRNSFVLTPQRILQTQYETSMSDIDDIDLFSFYGKSNYTCLTKKTTCDVGELVKPKCSGCLFQQAKNTAKETKELVLNYRLGLTSFLFTDTFDKRNLIVFDECHTLEEHLVNLDALTISEWRCKRYNLKWKRQQTLDGAYNWIETYYLPEMEQILDRLERECEPLQDKAGTDLTKPEIKKLQELKKLIEHVDEVALMLSRDMDYINDKFVLVYDSTMFMFKRLSGSYAFKKVLEPKANSFLFMSSTILNKEGFCRDLGINPDEAAFLSLDSEFDVQNRPVYFMPQMKMNASWKQPENKTNQNMMVDTILKLLSMHEGESGLIHTGNFEIATWLTRNIENKTKHTIYHHNPESGDDRNAIIEGFLSEPKPSILISPSCTEGLDLKYNLARFAIFVKVPFGFLGDQWIKRKMELSKEWYSRRAMIDIIQGGGRVVRDYDDHGSVYILDASFDFLYNQTHNMVPNWWKAGFHRI